MTSGESLTRSASAGQDFTSAHMYHCVNIDATDTTDHDIAVELAGAGENAVGVIQTYEVTGKQVNVIFAGLTKAVAGAAVLVNKPLKVDANGRLIQATTNNDICVAWSWSAASADGEVMLVNFCAPFYYGA